MSYYMNKEIAKIYDHEDGTDPAVAPQNGAEYYPC